MFYPAHKPLLLCTHSAYPSSHVNCIVLIVLIIIIIIILHLASTDIGTERPRPSPSPSGRNQSEPARRASSSDGDTSSSIIIGAVTAVAVLVITASIVVVVILVLIKKRIRKIAVSEGISRGDLLPHDGDDFSGGLNNVMYQDCKAEPINGPAILTNPTYGGGKFAYLHIVKEFILKQIILCTFF